VHTTCQAAGRAAGGMGGGGMGGFGGRARGSGATRGGDEQVEMRISFEDAVFGMAKEIEVNRLVACDACKGTGEKPNTSSKTCSACNGQGVVVSVVRTPLGVFQQQTVRAAAARCVPYQRPSFERAAR
jgi:molecular chaperone DnaJ